MTTEGGGLREPPVASVREQGNAVVVVLQGELDLYNLEDVRKALAEAARSGLRVVVDLALVEFVDSTVIGALVEAHKRAAPGKLELAAATEQTHRVLSIAGVDSYLAIRDTVADAIDA